MKSVPLPFLQAWRKRLPKDNSIETHKERSRSSEHFRSASCSTSEYANSFLSQSDIGHGDFFNANSPSHIPDPSPTAAVMSKPWEPIQVPERPPRPPSLYDKTESPKKLFPNINHEPIPQLGPYYAHRRVPELDGTWKGFLSDVDEDLDSLLTETQVEAESNSGKPSAVPKVDDWANVRGLSRSACVPKIRTTRSASNLRSMDRDPRHAKHHQPCPSDPIPHLAHTLTLFPPPPPLIIRKNAPRPLVLRPTVPMPTIPSSPETSSCDSTPLATPTSASPTPGMLRKHKSTYSLNHSRVHQIPGMEQRYRKKPPIPPDSRSHYEAENAQEIAINWGYAV